MARCSTLTVGPANQIERHTRQQLKNTKSSRPRILATTVKPYADDYRQAIEEWEAVKDWFEKNEKEAPQIESAEKKIKDLRRRLSGPRPRELGNGDRFKDQFGKFRAFFTISNKDYSFLLDAVNVTGCLEAKKSCYGKIGLIRIVVRKRHLKKPFTHMFSVLLKSKKSEIGKISVGRWDNIRRYAEAFGDQVGGDKSC